MSKRSPWRYAALVFGLYFLISALQRLSYITWIYFLKKEVPSSLASAFAHGISFDLVAGFFLFLPLLVFLAVGPKTLFEKRLSRSIALTLTVFPFILILFSILSEAFFFEEFQSRFNFIAVDYLIYTQEVVRNIWESYPMVWILAGLGLVVLPFAVFLSRSLPSYTNANQTHLRRIVGVLGIALGVWAFGKTNLVSEPRMLEKDSYWTREVSKNTLYTLFSAYFRNTIDYHDFYATLPSKEANHIAHEWLEEEPIGKTAKAEAPGEDEESIVRNIVSSGPAKDWNVIFVVMESMSAKFLGHYGGPPNLTPNLDRLADEGLFFSKLYATGTRTVRGLEALMLSIPPTPGQSILRRPNSDGLFNVGTVFKDHGYENQFLYGGYGYFDNMREWFSSNGFNVVDRADFPKNEIEFTNAWGVCDEDLFKQVIKNADELHAKKKKFFQVVMTTSNHRPYTYPAGRIDIPSHSGRPGAVKYSDYAVGELIRQAKTKSWFDHTVFVFVADHDASVAGGTDVPVPDFLIPAIFYAPKLIQKQTVAKISSQIDLGPTLLGLLGFNYQSRFYGQDLLKAQAGRALMGTYQKVAWMESGKIVVLSPGKWIEEGLLDDNGNLLKRTALRAADASSQNEFIKLTVALYQSASELFASGKQKLTSELPLAKDLHRN